MKTKMKLFPTVLLISVLGCIGGVLLFLLPAQPSSATAAKKNVHIVSQNLEVNWWRWKLRFTYPLCGNGSIDLDEQCDGADLKGKTCQSLGYKSGKLRCSKYTCQLNDSMCQDDTTKCGNGKIDGREQCDGANSKGASCSSLGLNKGTLSCTDKCTFNYSRCETTLNCGNGEINPGEECDDAKKVTKRCEDFGYSYGGSLYCMNCKYYYGQCTHDPL